MNPPRRPSRRDGRGRQRLDPKREILLHYVTDGPAKGWMHTHGLTAHGNPELRFETSRCSSAVPPPRSSTTSPGIS